MTINLLEEARNRYKIPFSCPLCQLIMKGKSSSTYFRHGVCVMCSIEFVEGREERWKSGWRPDAEELERYLKSRA